MRCLRAEPGHAPVPTKAGGADGRNLAREAAAAGHGARLAPADSGLQELRAPAKEAPRVLRGTGPAQVVPWWGRRVFPAPRGALQRSGGVCHWWQGRRSAGGGSRAGADSFEPLALIRPCSGPKPCGLQGTAPCPRRTFQVLPAAATASQETQPQPGRGRPLAPRRQMPMPVQTASLADSGSRPRPALLRGRLGPAPACSAWRPVSPLDQPQMAQPTKCRAAGATHKLADLASVGRAAMQPSSLTRCSRDCQHPGEAQRDASGGDGAEG